MLKKNIYRYATTNVTAFTDGKCSVYSVEKHTVKDKLGTFDFHEDTVGIQAYTDFQTIGIQIDKTISIPYNNLCEIGRVLKINQDNFYYRISMIQVKDTFPKTLKLSLEKTNISWNEVEGTKND